MKTLPHDINAEIAVIGGCLLNSGNIPKVSRYIDRDDFYLEKHQFIFEALQELNAEHIQADLVTLRDRLIKKDTLKKIGEDYISSIVDAVSTSAGWLAHANIIRRHSISRKIILRCGAASEQLHSQYEDPDEVISGLKNSLRQITASDDEEYSNYKLYGGIYDELGDKAPGYEPGYRLGIGNIDDHFYFEPGYIHCVCAESNIGKSPFMIQVADFISQKYGRTLYFTLESTRKKLAQRILARHTHIHLSRMHHKNLSEDDFGRMSKANNNLIKSNLILIDNSKYLYIEDLINYVESEAMTTDLKFIVIDFLQYQYTHTKQNSRHHEISYILSKYKALAKDLNIPLLYASQLDKSMQKRADHERRPKVGDLKESGDIQTMTDNILALYAPDKITSFNNNPVYAVEIFTLKSKDQQPFSTWLNFNGHFQEFTDGERPLFVNDNRKRRKE